MYTRTPHLATCVPASTPRDLAFLEAATHSSTIVSQFFLAFIPSPGPGVPPDERCIANVDLSHRQDFLTSGPATRSSYCQTTLLLGARRHESQSTRLLALLSALAHTPSTPASHTSSRVVMASGASRQGRRQPSNESQAAPAAPSSLVGCRASKWMNPPGQPFISSPLPRLDAKAIQLLPPDLLL